MKKIWLATVLLLITPITQASEIPGTRVAGQGAVCGEGEGKALEINATTKQEWSYCFKREVIVAPTPTPTPIQPTLTQSTTPTQSAPETESTNVSSGSTSDSPTVTVQPTPTPTPTPTPIPTIPSAPETPERSNVYEVNASTNVTTVREETVEEWLGRILFGWNNWYEELMAWFASIFG